VLLRKIQLNLIDVAPAPAFTRLDRPHDRMLRLLKMLRRMLVQRRIAAPYMPTLQTHPQVNPRAADLQTLLTPVGRRLHTPDLVQMGTLHGSTFLEPRFYPPRMAPYKWAKTKPLSFLFVIPEEDLLSYLPLLLLFCLSSRRDLPLHLHLRLPCRCIHEEALLSRWG